MVASFVRKNLKKLVILFLACGLLGIGALYYLKTSKSIFAINMRSSIGDFIYNRTLPKGPAEDIGLSKINNRVLYIDGEIAKERKPRPNRDNKAVLYWDGGVRLYDYASGFFMDFPSGTVFDFSTSPKYVTVINDDFKAVISRDWSVGLDVTEYIDYYYNRFILNETFQSNNGVTLLSHDKTSNRDIVRVSVADMPADAPDGYTYATFMNDTRFFHRIMFKYDNGSQSAVQSVDEALESYGHFIAYGRPTYNTDYYPILPDNWTEQTKSVYDELCSSDDVAWGIFTQDMPGVGIDTTIPDMEDLLGYKFEIVLKYDHLTEPFPMEFMRRCYNEGRLVELTYQITDNNNEDLYAASPLLGIFRGAYEEKIRNFARGAAEFGEPFFFRLNNEMNSDWTSYGGVNNLSDPDIYIAVWRQIYEIFQEEGVNNAIWVFNPNDRDCPPAGWNNQVAYYPGNEYVHMYGVTGYNNGSYYADVTGEYWREFDVIYQSIVNDNAGMFDAFPWIITEFSSSSVGGDKVAWINNMFNALSQFPQIKAAVWFSYADYDFRPENEGIPSRPYWLDETPETLEAFRQGLHR